MRGVILAGGTGSRLFPLTQVTNKHLLPIGDKPMLQWSIEKLVEANIRDILVVSGLEHIGAIANFIGSGKRFDCSFTLRAQEEAGGIAQALGLAKDFCRNDKFCVLLGDNIFEDSLVSYVNKYEWQQEGAMVLLKKVPDPQRYGVCIFDSNNKLIGIEEKPDLPRSRLAVTGIYFYDSNVFNLIPNLKPSNRGELEITDVNNYYVQNGTMDYLELKGFWTDAGSKESLKLANDLVRML